MNAYLERASHSPDGLSAVVTETGAHMGKRRTLGQRVVEYFMTAPIAEIRAAVDVAKVIVEAREAGHDQITWPAPKPKVTRKPRAKKVAAKTEALAPAPVVQ